MRVAPRFPWMLAVVLGAAPWAVGACGDGDKSADAKAAKADDTKAKPDETKTEADAKVDDAKASATDGGSGAAGPAAGSDDGASGDTGGTGGGTGEAPLPTLEPGDEGPAYFAVRDRGVVKLDAAGFTLVEGAPDLLLRDMHIGVDGKLYLLSSKGIMRIDDAKATMVAETSFKTTGTVDAFEVAADGALWAVGYKGISQWDGKAWKIEDKKVLGSDVTLIKGITIDGKDQVWVVSSNKLHLREGEAWVDVDVSSAFKRKPFFESIRRSPEGTAYAIASAALLEAKTKDEVAAVDLSLEGFSSLSLLTFSQNGIMALRSKVDAVLVRNPDGTTVEYAAGKTFEADSIRAVGVDSLGRAWIGTDIGLAIVGPGEDKVQWNSGSVLELAGHVEHIAVFGAGPQLPDVGPVKTGGIKGKVLDDGTALSETEIEMCPSPDTLFKTSPCGDSPVKFAGKTDAGGEFSFDAVPIGAYGIAVKVGGKWQLTMSSNFGTKMKEGETYDIGSINVKAAK